MVNRLVHGSFCYVLTINHLSLIIAAFDKLNINIHLKENANISAFRESGKRLSHLFQGFRCFSPEILSISGSARAYPCLRPCLPMPAPVLTHARARAYPSLRLWVGNQCLQDRRQSHFCRPAQYTPPRMSATPAQAIGVSRSPSTTADPIKVNTGFR